MLLLLMLTLIPARASAPAQPKAWFACKKASDCIVAGFCTNAVLNKKYVKLWLRSGACDMPPYPDSSSKAACVKRKCVLDQKQINVAPQ